MAEKAGKAAPAAVAVGAMAATAHVPAVAHTGGHGSAAVQTVVHARLDAVAKPAQHPARTYTVRTGDTLSAIAEHYYGHAADWHWLYHVNRNVVHNPDVIYAGEVLKVPHDPPATLTAYRAGGDSDHGTGDYQPRHAKSSQASGTGATTAAASGTLSGTLGCNGLEALWRDAGGAPSAAVTAASIAMAESGGNQYATGTVGERGYWQINPVNGSLSTYNPLGNAHAAVVLSHDGTNWSPWTTYTSGAYAGRC